MTSNKPKVLVTGASSGIGAATAVELARRGMAVAVHYFNNEDGGQQTVQAGFAVRPSRSPEGKSAATRVKPAASSPQAAWESAR